MFIKDLIYKQGNPNYIPPVQEDIHVYFNITASNIPASPQFDEGVSLSTPTFYRSDDDSYVAELSVLTGHYLDVDITYFYGTGSLGFMLAKFHLGGMNEQNLDYPWTSAFIDVITIQDEEAFEGYVIDEGKCNIFIFNP